MIDTVLFDFVNTLAFLEPRKELLFQKFIKKQTGETIPLQYIQVAYDELDGELPYSSVKIQTEDAKRGFYTEYNKRLFQKFNVAGYQDFYDYYHSTPKRWALDADAPKILKRLKEMPVRVGVVSNFDGYLETLLAHLGIHGYLDFIAISQKIGLEKPDVEFYKFVQNEYNLNLSRALYIGDSYSLDYLPATEVGFNSVLIDRNNVCSAPVKSIKSLLEIMPLVKTR